MSARKHIPWFAAAVLAVLGGGAVASLVPDTIGAFREAGRSARTYPEYRGITVPFNLAPLNLRILEPGREFCLRVSAAAGPGIEVFHKSGDMRIPAEGWRRLLDANRGGELKMDVFVKGDRGWLHFDTARNRIAEDAIDPYVVYRYIPAIFSSWRSVSLHQRDLRSFDDRVVLDNMESAGPDGRTADGVCVNCHTFLNHRTRSMLIHIRPSGPAQVPAMILVKDGKATKLDMRDGDRSAAAYASWRPDGKLLVFSRNRIMQVFHTVGEEPREVVDLDSDLAVYDVDAGRLVPAPAISRPDRLETFPSWSPDGRYLYFTSTAQWSTRPNAPLYYEQVRYDLNRISYDPATGHWGEVETLLSAARFGRSVSLPQVSADGRYVMFCGHEFGSFPVFQASSDLYLLDVSRPGAEPRRLDELNSDRSESYHAWSSAGTWVIFSSKREDGRFARLYLARMDGGGRFTKPFVIPQEDPDFYARCLMTYNRPELLVEPVATSDAELVQAINSAARQPLGAAPPSARRGGSTDAPQAAVR